MNRTEKEQNVALLNRKFSDARFVSLVDFKGLNVNQISNLRHDLREAETEFRVIKNTLARRAIRGTDLESLEEHLIGPLAVALTRGDPAPTAKVLTKFAKENPNLEVKVGLLEGKPLSASDIVAISSLPPREALLAQLLGTLNAPPAGFVNVLAGILRKLVGTLQAIEQKKSESNEA